MKQFVLIIGCIAMISTAGMAQDFPGKGNLALGLRTTGSFFGSDPGSFGHGTGGQFRLQFTDRINSEWYADLITTNIQNAGRRVDGHIGWSVMFYFMDPAKKIVPYVEAGHCFDYTKITAFSSEFNNNEEQTEERWSSAVQMGAGAHFNLTERFDITLKSQYMLHLGNDVHAHVHEHGGIPHLEIEAHDGSSFEGHLLVTLSVNYKIADLW